jgi:uncharacterized protein (DUF1501 family)
LLQTGLAWAVSQSVPRTARAITAGYPADRTLVLLHLSGGNDALNTLIPYADPLYYELRPRLSREAQRAIPIDNRVGLHRSLSALVPLFERGCLAIVQGVGYPEPDYSHVGSCRIWATGTQDAGCRRHWWDGPLSQLQAQAACVGTDVSRIAATPFPGEVTVALGNEHSLLVGRDPASYKPRQIETTLASIARIVSSERPPALIVASVGGFDTHTDQLERHEDILRRLGDGLAAFQRELESRARAERVLLMAWSEFGRRPAENAGGGTDHGSAGPVFLLGKKIRAGLYGAMPSLDETDFGDLRPTVDFRTIYTVLADRWLGCPTAVMTDANTYLPIL